MSFFSFFKRAAPTPPPQPSRKDEILKRIDLIEEMRREIGNGLRNFSLDDSSGVWKQALNQLNVERAILNTELLIIGKRK